MHLRKAACMRFVWLTLAWLLAGTAQSADPKPGYAILVDDAILSGDMRCLRTCLTATDCDEESQCLEAAAGRVCVLREHSGELWPCD